MRAIATTAQGDPWAHEVGPDADTDREVEFPIIELSRLSRQGEELVSEGRHIADGLAMRRADGGSTAGMRNIAESLYRRAVEVGGSDESDPAGSGY